MLVIDAGNTRIKLALFENDEIVKFATLSSEEISSIEAVLKDFSYSKAIISSVRSEEDTNFILSNLKNCFHVKDLIYPIEISYLSKDTLGTDRIANAVAAKMKSKGNALVIDVGTCIKFDFVNENGVYEGGSISPGINLRYKSLNDYTAKLPLLNETSRIDFLGKTTHECIQSGVLNGIQGEINYLISSYSQKYKDLTIFVTGGDASHFDYSDKNNIFVLENLSLFGLASILKANEL
ncbi:MAG: type III pantothenate kinase [Bacteroidota bacterium]